LANSLSDVTGNFRGRTANSTGGAGNFRPDHRTHDGRKYRLLNVIDEYSKEALATVPARRYRAEDVLDVLADLFLLHGPPEHIRSDNGPEFAAKAIRDWLDRLGVRTLFIEPGSPWENGYIESFNARMRDELLDREIFYSLEDVRVMVENWRVHYNTVRPHSALGYRPPSPKAIAPPAWLLGSAMLRLPPRLASANALH
jgi:transposase InsO family protein